MTAQILVVDDSALMRTIISDMLKSDKGIEVVGIAKNGLIALEKIKELKPDVVVMDLVMPEMDGIQTLKEIMKNNPLPVIMLSAHTQKDSDKSLSALSLGAVDFVLKPSGEIQFDVHSGWQWILFHREVNSK